MRRMIGGMVLVVVLVSMVAAKPAPTIEYRYTNDPTKAGVRYRSSPDWESKLGPVYQPAKPGKKVITIYKRSWWDYFLGK